MTCKIMYEKIKLSLIKEEIKKRVEFAKVQQKDPDKESIAQAKQILRDILSIKGAISLLDEIVDKENKK